MKISSSGQELALGDVLVGDSPAMAELRKLIRQVAPSNASVFVTGPSGSGKEVVARAIHDFGQRSSRSYVPVNCGAIPRELLESELFGHEKGSFTGAHAQHRGRFEEADGGTLFLDEIGDMPHDMQVKLLRVLEERAVQRVGGRGQIAVDTRIVSATHRDIDAAIDEQRFREDLFYRLAVFPVDIPSLAERSGDVPALVRHFARRGSDDNPARFSNSALDRLVAHGWPGNVRELRNIVERANILYPDQELGAEQVELLLVRRGRLSVAERAALWQASEPPAPEPAPVEADASAESSLVIDPSRGVDLRSVLAEIERRYIEEALDHSSGVVADAARMLSLQRTTLIEKMRKYELKAA
ncbi:MAG: sigma-54 interaction domain-containing protein [Allosphingosinicella sp.]